MRQSHWSSSRIVLLSAALLGVPLFAAATPALSEPPDGSLYGTLVSVVINGQPVGAGSAPLAVTTDEVFVFNAEYLNSGTDKWSHVDGRSISLFSRNPDYNSDFGTFIISPGQNQATLPGEKFTYTSKLKAPSAPGTYEMVWQPAEWVINDLYSRPYEGSPWVGDQVSVTMIVTERSEKPPISTPKPGVVDASDLEYVGSFGLPTSPGVAGWESFFTSSGLALRTVDGEKRLLMIKGTYDLGLYEVALPDREDLGKVDGVDFSSVREAEFRTSFGLLDNGTEGDLLIPNGTSWFNQATSTLYWTHWNSYDTRGPEAFPVLNATKLEGELMSSAGRWYLSTDLKGPYKGYWGGVTSIPQEFADQYTGGRTLGLGFGGFYSIIATASRGPSLAAAAVPSLAQAGGKLDMQEVIYYPADKGAPRDGNYLNLVGWWDSIPQSPWQGKWASADSISSGVFIDLPDKKGYLVLAKQAVGRIGYDYGGSNWNGRYQNAWYFYDYETLGQAATGEIAAGEAQPSSFTTIEYPGQALTAPTVYEAGGSVFDPETRLLYVYMRAAAPGKGMYMDPLVHVYYIAQDGSTPTPTPTSTSTPPTTPTTTPTATTTTTPTATPTPTPTPTPTASSSTTPTSTPTLAGTSATPTTPSLTSPPTSDPKPGANGSPSTRPGLQPGGNGTSTSPNTHGPLALTGPTVLPWAAAAIPLAFGVLALLASFWRKRLSER